MSYLDTFMSRNEHIQFKPVVKVTTAEDKAELLEKAAERRRERLKDWVLAIGA